MTIEDLLNCSADKLEAMSDQELELTLAPFFNVTKPELARKESVNERIAKPSFGSRGPQKESITKSEAYKKAREIAAQMGLKI